jgi:hypothetical protein
MRIYMTITGIQRLFWKSMDEIFHLLIDISGEHDVHKKIALKPRPVPKRKVKNQDCLTGLSGS